MNIVQQLTQELMNCTKDFTALETELRETRAILESTKRSEETLREQLRQAHVVIQELAHKILALMKQAEEDGAKAVSETFEQDYYLAAWDNIKKLCQEVEKRSGWEPGAVEERRMRLREGSPEVIYRVDAEGNVL